MSSGTQQVAGVVGVLLTLTAFLLGVLFQVGAAWFLLLVGAVLMAYALYCGSRPFLRERME